MHGEKSTRTEQKSEGRQRPRKANECITEAKQFEPPELLFDEFWRTGELALLFGATGTGKSVLAVQIADAIARGRAIDGFEMSARRQKVLYVDLKLSDLQFEMRYCGETRHYKFSENLYRDRPPSIDGLCEWLQEMIRENGIRTIVIDDLSAIKRTYDGTRETLALMRQLRQLTQELGVSILVLTPSREPGRSGLVSETDMQRSRVLCDAADSVFAIGRHPSSAADGYLIQTRSQSNAIYWQMDNAPVCRMTNADDGFFGFRFDERFAAEIDEETRDLICNVKWAHDAGASYRLIAEDLGISKSTVARLCKKWTPEMERHYVTVDEEEESGRKGVEKKSDAETVVTHNSAMEQWMDDDEHDENDPYWEEIGIKPRGFSHPGLDDLDQAEACALNGGTAANYTSESDGKPKVFRTSNGAAARDVESAGFGSTVDTQEQEQAEACNLNQGLKRSVDGYGREIFIEKETDGGKPVIWYWRDPNGKIYRKKRQGGGVIVKLIDEASVPALKQPNCNFTSSFR